MYGLYKFDGRHIIEVHQDISSLARSVDYSRQTVTRWLSAHGGAYEGRGFIIVDDVEVFKSDRGRREF